MKKIYYSILVLLLIGCTTKRDIFYLQDIDQTQLEKINEVMLKTRIQVNDILSVRMTALDPESVSPFMYNKAASLSGDSPRDIEMLRLKGYLVDKDGNIKIPQLGELYVKGKTTEQVEKMIEQKLSVYITNPTVAVRLINYKISVIGEVNEPGTYTLSEAHITLPQALGLAGDLTIHGQRDHILIVRTKGGQRIYKYIDLTQSDWMNSPFYYLRQNDVIYVPPNGSRVKSAGFIGSIGNVLSVASILLSAAVVIFR